MKKPCKNKYDNDAHPPPPYLCGAAIPNAIPPITFYQDPALIECLELCFVLLVVVIMAIFTAIVHITEPLDPELQVDSATFTLLNLTDASELTARWNINLVVSNPNPTRDISYDAVSAGVFYHSNELLSSTRLAPFSQQNLSKTALRVRFEVVDSFVDNDEANGIASGRARGLVEFGVMFRFSAFIRYNLRYGNPYTIRISCYPLRFALSYNANNATGVLSSGLTCNKYFGKYIM